MEECPGCSFCISTHERKKGVHRRSRRPPGRSNKKRDAADALVMLEVAIVRRVQQETMKRIKLRVYDIKEDMNEWVGRQSQLPHTIDNVSAYISEGAVIYKRVEQCERDMKDVQCLQKWQESLLFGGGGVGGGGDKHIENKKK